MKQLLKAVLLSCFAIAIASLSAHCANDKEETAAAKQQTELAYFAGGCFWKVQHIFSRLPGVIKTRAGFMGGSTQSPSYKEVCSDKTGHAETVKVEFDPSKISYRKLLETFFNNHNPTTLNRQGPDVGSQYRSAIFYSNKEQRKEAQAYKEELDKSKRFRNPVLTKIEKAGAFYDAEEYHQDYFAKHGISCD